MSELYLSFFLEVLIYSRLFTNVLLPLLLILIICFIVYVKSAKKGFSLSMICLFLAFIIVPNFAEKMSKKINVEYCREQLGLSEEKFNCFLSTETKDGVIFSYIKIQPVFLGQPIVLNLYSLKSKHITDKPMTASDEFYIKINEHSDYYIDSFQLFFEKFIQFNFDHSTYSQMLRQKETIKTNVTEFYIKKQKFYQNETHL